MAHSGKLSSPEPVDLGTTRGIDKLQDAM